MAQFWTKERLAKAKALARDSLSSSEFESRVSKEFKTRLSANAIRIAFKSAGLESPATFFKRPDYVAELQERESAHKDKQVIKTLTHELRDLRDRESIRLSLDAAPREVKVLAPGKSDKRNMVAVVLASDWHIEETVLSASVAGVNKYNLQIAEQRIERFFQAIVWTLEHHRADGQLTINELVLWLGGDFISGFIHEELREMNALSPTQSIIWLVPKLIAGIKLLLQNVKKLVIPCNHGNHGRTTFKSHVSNGYANSFEWLMYHWIAEQFKDDKRVEFLIVPSEHNYVSVYSRTLHFHHGDNVRYGGGVNGLAVPVGKAAMAWDKIRFADIHNIGHFHSLLFMGNSVVNGSLIGYAPYGMSIRANPEMPQQAMYFIDNEKGFCMPSALWVD